MKKMLVIYSLLFLLSTLGFSTPFLVESRTNESLNNPQIAYDFLNKQYLIVWERHVTSTNWDINGQLLDASGNPVGSVISIATDSTYQYVKPKVAFDLRNERYLVIYGHRPDETYEIEGTFIEADGDIISQFDIWDSEYHSYQDVALVYNPGCHEYLMVELDKQGDTYLIYAVRLNEDAGVKNQMVPDINTTYGREMRNPAVACAGCQYLVVWEEDMDNGDVDIRSRLFKDDDYGSDILDIGHAYAQQSHPSVTYNTTSGQFYVVWQALHPSYNHYRIHGRLVNPDGTQGLIYTVAGDSENGMITPEVVYTACCQNTFLVIWAQGTIAITSHGIAARRMEWDSTMLPGQDPFWIVEPGGIFEDDRNPVVRMGNCGDPLIAWQHSISYLGGDIGYSIKGNQGVGGEIKGDLDCNYVVDIKDLAIFSANWLIGI